MSKEIIPVTFKDDNGKEVTKKIRVDRPSNDVATKADRYRAKIWAECIRDGVMTKMQVEKMLAEQNVWGEQEQKEYVDLLQQIADAEKELFLGSEGVKTRKLSEGKDLAIKIRGLRLSLRGLMAQKASLEDSTAEALADNARLDYLTSACTYYENGKKVYKSVEDYNSRNADAVAFTAASKMAEMIYGLDRNFEQNLPENRWLKQFGLVNDDLHIIDDEKRTVDIEGRVVNELGQYVDDEGNVTDRLGNPLDETGNYVLQVEYEPDE